MGATLHRGAGATLHRGARASHYHGPSRCGARAPDAQAQQLWLTGPVAPRHVVSSQTRARTRVPCISRQILNHCTTREARALVFLKAPQMILVCRPNKLDYPVRIHWDRHTSCEDIEQYFLLFFFKLINLFLTALGLRCCTQAFSSCGEQGLLFIAARRLLIAVASLVAEHGL